MAWGTLTIGGVVLRETMTADQDGPMLRIAGQESHPPSTRAHVESAHHNMKGLGAAARDGLEVPLVATDKTGLIGFYRLLEAKSVLTVVQNGLIASADWSASLELIGHERDVEAESLLPLIGRSDELSGTQTPSFWHAPPVGHTSYLTGSTVPSGSVARTSSEGVVTVYTGLPAGFSPRWTVAAGDYRKGATRLLFDGILRVGKFTPPLTEWEMHNGLVHVTGGAAGSFTVSCWDDGQWRSAKSYAVTVAGVALTGEPEVTVLGNDPEECRLRLSYAGSPGRTTVDLSLRRGARFVTGTIKRHSSATLGVTRTAADAGTEVTGGVKATAVDADGNRYVLGSSRLVTTATGTAAISKASVTQFDFFAGHEVGSSPAAGDAFADLLLQYLAAGGERVRIVKR